MNNFRIIILLAMAFLLWSGSVQADSPKTILTSLPVTHALCDVLCEGTDIDVIQVVPSGYSMHGHKAYLKKHRKEFFEKTASAQAVVSLASVWAADPLYMWARRGNISIVNIDAGKPLDGYGAGVPLMEINDGYVPYVWRSPANLTRMGSIVADDLARLYPGEAERITANLKKLQSALFKLRANFEEKFLGMESNDYGALTDGYVYLADEFGLNIHFHFLKQENDWTTQDAIMITDMIQNNGIKIVICPWQPDATASKAINNGGAHAAVLEKFIYEKGKGALAQLIRWFSNNLSVLATE